MPNIEQQNQMPILHSIPDESFFMVCLREAAQGNWASIAEDLRPRVVCKKAR